MKLCKEIWYCGEICKNSPIFIQAQCDEVHVRLHHESIPNPILFTIIMEEL